MLAEERRERLLEMVRQRGFASLRDLSGELAVSESTIRRDLDQLEESGSARRSHGGVFYAGPSPKLSHFDLRQSSNWDKKRQIARCAAELIEDGETILLDGGSTTYELAQQLVGRPLQIVTNSLPVANLFMASESAELILLGGYVHTRTGVSLGPYANDMLRHIHVKHAVLSVASIHEDGAYNSNLLLVETERAMMAAADEVVVVADSTKFGHKSLSQLCPLSAIHSLVVDDEMSEDWRSRMIAAGVHLHVASSTPAGETAGLE
ncbi:DeoR/GlpR family DNA-binding transcription regulator [Lignipirellula cremea]|uniref:HTH-type transcriptional regulator UlaR n=1 Tax=Lignipirellula cremea TaxID=2528010 RepID=A0A518DMP6_9BACT|nr:DeoR/GlpR family DNA-binding transcription regulator [Lignipirellula cremea]QDU93117.1 HTH-type transcriptional regulator UlaR [Lignipirellula cremea]